MNKNLRMYLQFQKLLLLISFILGSLCKTRTLAYLTSQSVCYNPLPGVRLKSWVKLYTNCKEKNSRQLLYINFYLPPFAQRKIEQQSTLYYHRESSSHFSDSTGLHLSEETQLIKKIMKSDGIVEMEHVWNSFISTQNSSLNLISESANNRISVNIIAAMLKKSTDFALAKENQCTSTDEINRSIEYLNHLIPYLSREETLLNISESSISSYAIVNILIVFSRVAERSQNNTFSDQAEALCKIAYSQPYFTTISPKTLVYCLQAMSKLRLSSQYSHELYKMIGKRLQMGDALSKLSPVYIARVLRSISVLGSITYHRDSVGIVKALIRRFRKQSVREKASPKHFEYIITSIATIVYSMQNSLEITEEMKQIVLEEAQTLWHTSLRAIIGNYFKPVSFDDAGNALIEQDSYLIQSFNLSQIANIYEACIKLKFSQEDSVLLEFTELLAEYRTADIIKSCSMNDLYRTLWCLHKLKLGWHTDYIESYAELIYELGKRFEELTLANTQNETTSITPTQLSKTLRSVILMYPGYSNHDITTPYLRAVSSLFLEKVYSSEFQDENHTISLSVQPSPLLQKCNAYEISNIVWVLAKAQWHDLELLNIVGKRICDAEVLSYCSSRSASKILWSYSKILSDFEKTKHSNQLTSQQIEDFRKIQFDLFHRLDKILLIASSSTQLLPIDASSAMWAMSKASYFLDLGIFDRLAKAFSYDDILQHASTIHITNALWACGKMMTWEHQNEAPPYLTYAKLYCKELCKRVDEMNNKDFAQSIWAMGRLNIDDTSYVNIIASELPDISSQCNCREISNILWGLSKVNFHDESIVKSLTTQLLQEEVLQHCTPQEASNILLALGRMKMQDKEVFEKIANVLMENLSDVTAQAIANSLWAYQSVKLKPPESLLDCWAAKNFGFVGLGKV